MLQADQWWQSSEIAYYWVYGADADKTNGGLITNQPLPWEWRPEYALRTVIFPGMIAAPLYLLKLLGLDFVYIIVYLPLIIHCCGLLVMDWYFYKLGQKLVGQVATDIAMPLYLFNHTFGQQMHRLFSSSYEAMLGVISLYYFEHISTSFDRPLAIVIALQSFSFVIRNTSPIGWVVLLTVKAVKTDFRKMFQNYIIGFFIIFLPIFSISIALDSWYYGKLTIVPWNFIQVNVFAGLSQNFGADPLLKYVNLEIPIRFNIYFPCIVLGIAKYARDTWSKKQTPYLVYYILSILTFLSLISHKEPKFLLPIFPPIFLMIGYYLAVNFSKTHPKQLKQYIYFGVILEIMINLYFVHLHEVGAGTSVMKWIRSNYDHYDSLISLNKFEGNYYSWNHFHRLQPTSSPHSTQK